MKIFYKTPVNSSITDILSPPQSAKWGKNGANFENNSLFEFAKVKLHQSTGQAIANGAVTEFVMPVEKISGYKPLCLVSARITQSTSIILKISLSGTFIGSNGNIYIQAHNLSGATIQCFAQAWILYVRDI